MRILFVTTHYPPAEGFGGVCESGYGLSVALANAGVEVDVVTSDASKGGRVHPKLLSENEGPSNLRIFRFKYLFSEKSCFSFDAMKVISDRVISTDIVYINGVFTYPVTLGAWFSRRKNKPHIVAVRNGLDPWLFRIRRFRKMLGFHFYVKRDLSGSDCLHLTSKLEVEACRNFGLKGKYTIVPNGINSKDFENLPAVGTAEKIWPVIRNRTVILFLSRISPQKGLDMLLSVWDDVVRNFPNALLVIAGPDYMGYESEIRQIANKSAFSNSILFTGSVFGDVKISLFHRADIFVLPSYSENFGNVVAESLACGTPVITTHATPWSDLQKVNCGRWVPVNKTALLQAISEMIFTPSKDRKQMGQRGRKLILKKFTWDISAQRLISVFDSILNGKDVPYIKNF